MGCLGWDVEDNWVHIHVVQSNLAIKVTLDQIDANREVTEVNWETLLHNSKSCSQIHKCVVYVL